MTSYYHPPPRDFSPLPWDNRPKLLTTLEEDAKRALPTPCPVPQCPSRLQVSKIRGPCGTTKEGRAFVHLARLLEARGGV